MELFLVLSAIMFVLYNIVIHHVNKGFPESISNSFYILNGVQKGVGYVFTAWCYMTALAVMMSMFELSQDAWYQFLGLFAGGGLCLVGAAPNYKESEKKIHYTGAGLCAVSAFMYMLLTGYYIVPTVCMMIGLILSLVKRKSWLWFLEAFMFISMYIVLFHKYIE